MDFLNKIREFPKPKRKRILWVIIIILGLIFFILWIQIVQGKLKILSGEKFVNELRSPLVEKVKNMPQIDLSELNLSEIGVLEISEEEWKDLEKELSEEEIEELKEILKDAKKD